MACLAHVAIFAFVYVVLLVAVNAVFPETFIFINANLVTVHTFGPDVLADQTIIGFRVVIEECFFPALFVMACTAHWPELALVFGVLLMAFEA
jgi:hypothetical protein